MNMPDVWKPFNGSVSFVLLRHQTRWGLKCSTLVMGSSTLMVSTKRSGCVAINARKITIWSVLLHKKKASSSPFIAPLMSVGSRDQVKWVTPGLKRVVRWVIFPFTVAKQKMTPHKIKRHKDGRQIVPRKKASAWEGFKEQLWSVADLDLAFDLWEANKNKPPEEKLSKLAISKKTGIPYTTVCERLSGRRGGGKRGKIVVRKCQSKVLDEGMQAGLYRGFPFTGKQLCTLAYEMVTRDKKRGFSLVKMTAGRCWLRGFYKRHPEVRSKVPVNLSIAWAISANPPQISFLQPIQRMGSQLGTQILS